MHRKKLNRGTRTPLLAPSSAFARALAGLKNIGRLADLQAENAVMELKLAAMYGAANNNPDRIDLTQWNSFIDRILTLEHVLEK